MPELLVTTSLKALLATVNEPLAEENHPDLVGKFWLVRVELDQLVWSSRTWDVPGDDNRKKAANARMTVPDRLILYTIHSLETKRHDIHVLTTNLGTVVSKS